MSNNIIWYDIVLYADFFTGIQLMTSLPLLVSGLGCFTRNQVNVKEEANVWDYYEWFQLLCILGESPVIYYAINN